MFLYFFDNNLKSATQVVVKSILMNASYFSMFKSLQFLLIVLLI